MHHAQLGVSGRQRVVHSYVQFQRLSLILIPLIVSIGSSAALIFLLSPASAMQSQLSVEAQESARCLALGATAASAQSTTAEGQTFSTSLRSPTFDIQPFDEADGTNCSVALGDLDRDGDLDMVVGRYGHPNTVYENIGQGNFDPKPLSEESDKTRTLVLADMDGNGLLDIIVGNHKEKNLIYFNFNTSELSINSFFPSTFGTTDSATTDIAIGDINSPTTEVTYYDMLIGNETGNLEVYLNPGLVLSDNLRIGNSHIDDPDFTVATDNVQAIALADVDKDNLIDIIVGTPGKNEIFRNLGDERFGAEAFLFGNNRTTTTSLVVDDIDGDGQLDLIEGNYGNSNRIYYEFSLLEGEFKSEHECPFGGANSTTSIATADFNSDGLTDITVGNFGQSNILYLKDTPEKNCNFDPQKREEATNSTPNALSNNKTLGPTGTQTFDVVAGDIDNDGDIDTVAVGVQQPEPTSIIPNNVIYKSNGAGNYGEGWNLSQKQDASWAVAWGDLNGDSHLDVAIGNNGDDFVYIMGPNPITITLPATLTGKPNSSIALGDLNNDGCLDMVFGNWTSPSVVWLNDGTWITNEQRTCMVSGALTSTLTITPTKDVAIGDIDGDDDLDIVMANVGTYNRIYWNNGIGHFHEEPFSDFGLPQGQSKSVALGDVDNDSDLDLIVGNRDMQNFVYLNDGSRQPEFTQQPFEKSNEDWVHRFGNGNDATNSVAMADINGDGYLDIVVGNWQQPNVVYLNDGGAGFRRERDFGTGTDATNYVAVGHMNHDPYLDIVVGNYREQDFVYLNNSSLNFSQGTFEKGAALSFGSTNSKTNAVAVADADGNGLEDIVVAQAHEANTIYYGGYYTQSVNSPTANPLFIHVSRPITTDNADFFSAPAIRTQRLISIPYQILAPIPGLKTNVMASFSLNGGGQWFPAISAGNTMTLDVDVNTIQHFEWDTFASGLFGQTDNVIFRIDALQPNNPVPNTAASATTRASIAVKTFPFRVHGMQILILNENSPVTTTSTIVYRLSKREQDSPRGQGRPLGSIQVPLQTDHRTFDGVLRGFGKLNPGDQLIPLVPAKEDNAEGYTLYFTNATPNEGGISPDYTFSPNQVNVSDPDWQVQEVKVSSSKPLLLFDLDVALEWDSTKDSLFLAQLHRNLQRASTLLYDWSDGQMALGQIHVHQYNRESQESQKAWEDADIQIRASNRLRPNADVGGLISGTKSLVLTGTRQITITYDEGHVRIGPIWNRYGNIADGTVGDDWSGALAHELGHYLLFLEDNYLGLDSENAFRLIPIEGCNSAMADPYAGKSSEFHPDEGWEDNCGATLSRWENWRSDWAMIEEVYNALNAPEVLNDNSGPSRLPLAVTQISPELDLQTEPVEETRVFVLIDDKENISRTSTARAYLYKRNEKADADGDFTERLIDLGDPIGDRIRVRGARPGDRLCVYDLDGQESQIGCTKIDDDNFELEMHSKEGWSPSVELRPGNPMAITVTVDAPRPNQAEMKATLFLPGIQGQAQKDLKAVTSDKRMFTGTISLPKLSSAGYVRLRLFDTSSLGCDSDQDAPCETVINFAHGGSPCCQHVGNNTLKVSPDGEVLFYAYPTPTITFSETTLYSLQALTTLPTPPSWTKVAGQGYMLTKSADAPSFTETNTSLLFSYLARDIPPGEEPYLKVFYAPVTATTADKPDWRVLDTELNEKFNTASVSVEEEGIYVLLSTIDVMLHKGWNLFGYPIRGSTEVTKALASISGESYQIYGYNAGREPKWSLYPLTSTITGLAKLETLEFGHGYWINIDRPITLSLKGPVGSSSLLTQSIMASIFNSGSLPPSPPAIIHGAVESSQGISISVGMEVTATIHLESDAEATDTQLCGRGITKEGENQQIFYSVAISSDSQRAGCGTAGRKIQIYIEGHPMEPIVSWDNRAITNRRLMPKSTNQ